MAHMHPSANDTRCVTADTCGKRKSAMLVAKKTTVAGRLHQALDSAGVLMPRSANMMFDAPTGSEPEQNQESDAHIYEAATAGRVTFLQVRIIYSE